MDPSGYICCYQVSCLNRYIQTNSIAQHEIQIKNRIIKHVNVYVKIIVHAKENSSWNPSTKYLSILCPMKIVYVMDIKNDKYCTNKCYEYYDKKY